MSNATENKGRCYPSVDDVRSLSLPNQYVPPAKSTRSSRAGTVKSAHSNSDQVEYLWPIDPVLANLRFFNPDTSTKQVSKSSLFAKYAYEYDEETHEMVSIEVLNKIYRSFEKALKFIFQTLKNTSFATVYDFAKFMSNCIISMTDDFAQLEETLFKIQNFLEDVEMYGNLKVKAFNFVRSFNMLCAFLDYYHYEDIQMVFLSSYNIHDTSKTAIYLDFNKLCDQFYENWLVLYEELVTNDKLIVGPAPFINTSSLTNSDTVVHPCKKKFISEHRIKANESSRVKFACDSVYKVIKIPSGKDKCKSLDTFYLNSLIDENDRLKQLYEEFVLIMAGNMLFSQKDQIKLTVSKCVLFLIHENDSCYCVDNFRSVYDKYNSNYHLHYTFSLFACLDYLAMLRCNVNFFRNIHYLNQASMFLLTYQIYISPKNLLTIMLQTVFESLDVAIDKTDELLFYENKEFIRVRNWSVLLLDVLHNVFSKEIDHKLYIAFWLLHYRLSQLGLIKLAFELRFILLNFSLASPDDSHFTFEENFVRLDKPFHLANNQNENNPNNQNESKPRSLADVIRSLMKNFTAKEFATQICLQDENLFRLINPSELVSYSLCKSDFYDDSFDLGTNMSTHQSNLVNCSKGTSSLETENNENLEKVNENIHDMSKGASFICEANENYLKCKNVIKFIDRFNKISSLICILFSRSHIVSSKLTHPTDLDFLAKRKTEKLVLYLSTCLYFLLSFRNMNAFFAVGLIFVRYIHREHYFKIVKKHPKYCAKHPLIDYPTLDALMDSANNYQSYRKVLADSVKAPFIPHMAIILHDLNFYITEAQRNYFKKKHFLVNLLNDEKMLERFFGLHVDIQEDEEVDCSKNSSYEFNDDQVVLNPDLKYLFEEYKVYLNENVSERKVSIYNWKVGWQLYSCIFQSFVLAQKESYEFTENLELSGCLQTIERIYKEEKN